MASNSRLDRFVEDDEEGSDDAKLKLTITPKETKASPLDRFLEEENEIAAESGVDPITAARLGIQQPSSVGEGLGAQGSGFAQGFRDIPLTTNKIFDAALFEPALSEATDEYKKEFNEENPLTASAEFGRGLGGATATAPFLGVVGKGAALGLEATLGKTAAAPVVPYLTGGVGSNAIKTSAGTVSNATTGNLLKRAGASVVPASAAVQGEIAATHGGFDKPYLEQAKDAIIPGLIAGPAITMGGATFSRMFGKQAPSETKALYSAMMADGIDPKKLNPDLPILDQITQAGGSSKTLQLAKDAIASERPGDRLAGNTLGQFIEGRQKQLPENLTQEFDKAVDGSVLKYSPDESTQRLTGQYDAALNQDIIRAASGHQGGAISESAAKNLGVNPGTTYHSTVKEIKERGQELARPEYDAAFSGNKSVRSPVIDQILETSQGREALRGAVENMRLERRAVGIPDAELEEQAKLAGTYETGQRIAAGLNLRTLDYVKRYMDRMVNQAYKNSAPNAKSIEIARNELRAELDKADVTGRYAKARSIAQDEFANQDALDIGRGLLSNKGRAEQGELIANMSQTEKLHLQKGLQDAIEEKLGTSATADRSFLSTPNAKANIRMAFGSDAEAEKFIKEVQVIQKTKQDYKDVFGTLDKIKGNPDKVAEFFSDKANKEKALPFFKSKKDLDGYIDAAKAEQLLAEQVNHIAKLKKSPMQLLDLSSADIAAIKFKSPQDKQRFLSKLEQLKIENQTNRAVYTPPGAAGNETDQASKSKLMKASNMIIDAGSIATGGPDLMQAVGARAAGKAALNKLAVGSEAKGLTQAQRVAAGRKLIPNQSVLKNIKNIDDVTPVDPRLLPLNKFLKTTGAAASPAIYNNLLVRNPRDEREQQ